MKLSQRDIVQIQGRHRQRIRHQLQREFAGEGPESDLRGRYFDSFIALAESLPGSVEADHLKLLELGWLQQVALDQCPQFRECLARGKWYGRRYWLRDQLEKLTGKSE